MAHNDILTLFASTVLAYSVFNWIYCSLQFLSQMISLIWDLIYYLALVSIGVIWDQIRGRCLK